jgi:hypothetical protein
VKFGNEIRCSVDEVLDCDLGCGFYEAAGGYKFVEFLRVNRKLPGRDIGLSILTGVWI